MATPKKTPSGRWRVRVYLGQRDGRPVYVSVTEDTKRGCMDRAAVLRARGLPPEKPKPKKLGDIIDRYIESSETLSPTTLAGYRKIRRTMFQDIMDVDVSDLTDEMLQKAISAEMRRKSRRGHNISPKSIKNAWGLVRASLTAFTDYTPKHIKLPEQGPSFLELPEPDFVIQAVRGSDIELPCMLALWLSLSMSEVRGLKYSSIRNGCLYIDQVVVDVDGAPVEKARAKVASRNRCLALPDPLLDLIRSTTDFTRYERGEIFDDYLCKLKQYQIRRRLEKLLPGVTFHQLRHMNASVMLKLGVPDKYAMERGGWSTPSTMKRVYQHTFSDERQRVDAMIDEYFSKKYATKACNEAAKP